MSDNGHTDVTRREFDELKNDFKAHDDGCDKRHTATQVSLAKLNTKMNMIIGIGSFIIGIVSPVITAVIIYNIVN